MIPDEDLEMYFAWQLAGENPQVFDYLFENKTITELAMLYGMKRLTLRQGLEDEGIKYA